eukprot:TRINITY_DN23843_c0_g1_i1.p1 TRINITY_DN23843_c0_g1~~TRINITY_DN23843_c0_g1_i1.p1  ORF type:complete len:190 (-),score=6.96 TRINITY_DN23843_c0_g1_i1:139-708(-)
MAKLAVIYSVIFSLFLLSHARIPLYQLHDSVTDQNPITASSEDEPKTTLALPSEKGDIDTIAAVGIYRPIDSSFRPINRHFHHLHVKRPFGFRIPHRCRHHGRFRGPHFTLREVPYGDDMVLFPGRASGVSQIPGREFRFPIERHGFPIKGDLSRDEGRTVEQRHVDFQEEKKEEGGFMKWVRELKNRF